MDRVGNMNDAEEFLDGGTDDGRRDQKTRNKRQEDGAEKECKKILRTCFFLRLVLFEGKNTIVIMKELCDKYNMECATVNFTYDVIIDKINPKKAFEKFWDKL